MTTVPSRVGDDEDRKAADDTSPPAEEASTSFGNEKAVRQGDATASAVTPSVPPEQSYPTGLRYWMAVIALCMAIFLSTLVGYAVLLRTCRSRCLLRCSADASYLGQHNHCNRDAVYHQRVRFA